MTVILQASSQALPAVSRRVTLDELWAEAEQYGRVTVNTYKKGEYWAKITFYTIANTELKADSNFVSTPHEALQLAIEAAKKIREAFK